ncbi:MAG: hypothetical protein ACM3TT_07555 [Syntrophothermus sp.]
MADLNGKDEVHDQFQDEVDHGVLEEIAVECNEYEPIAEAQAYGISFLNNLESVDHPRCDQCLHWQDGQCEIFRREIVATVVAKDGDSGTDTGEEEIQ